jgi:hypothetical protein
MEAAHARFSRQLADICAVDFFETPERATVTALLADLEARWLPPETAARAKPPSAMVGRTWVTRQGLHVDRMASAWLSRRFIDPRAHFKFVPAKGYRVEAGELRFDMFDAEFTHEGDRCTFEVLLQRFSLAAAALRPLAEMIHDIDLKDAKFARADTAGFERLIAGIAIAHAEDDVRLARASAVLDDLFAYFERQS